MFSVRPKALFAAFVLSLLCFVSAIGQGLPADPAGKSLPNNIGEYRAAGPFEPHDSVLFEDLMKRNGITSHASRDYVSTDGRRFSVSLVTAPSDSAAYAMYTEERRRSETSGNEGGTAEVDVGTSGYFYWDGLHNDLGFVKGRVSAYVIDDGKTRDSQPLINFGKILADKLDKGEGQVPVLIKHLPDWQKVRLPLYIVSVETLKQQYAATSVFDVVSFEGGAEAVQAKYGDQTLVIVEFTTPQTATEQDHRITARIQELRAQGQPVPSAYRRVGNYAVFVFDAANQATANQLIDQVKYQQVVTWLGENPFSYEKATREFTETTLGVLVSVVKASGIALVSCLAIGGFAGALLFNLRRSQQRAREAYADSDAMLRLNIDELTPEKDSTRLVGSGH